MAKSLCIQLPMNRLRRLTKKAKTISKRGASNDAWTFCRMKLDRITIIRRSIQTLVLSPCSLSIHHALQVQRSSPDFGYLHKDEGHNRCANSIPVPQSSVASTSFFCSGLVRRRLLNGIRLLVGCFQSSLGALPQDDLHDTFQVRFGVNLLGRNLEI